MRYTDSEIAARTPDDRYRYADALRLGALLVVVLGHWLLIVIFQRNGTIDGGSILVVEPWTQWATWLAQVMPVFFFVGGFANRRSLALAVADGNAPADWIRARARRLLLPVLPLVVLWAVAVASLAAAGVAPRLLALGSTNALIPAWFLAVYLVVLSLAPLTLRLHERFGVAVLIVGAGGAVICDALGRLVWEPVGWLNFLFVWGVIHQAGYLWAEERLPRKPAAGLALVAAGIATLAAMTQWFSYPITMVDFDQYGRSNNVPPTAALLALGTAQLGLIQLARPTAERLLDRPAAWAAVTRTGAVTMTIFLWHMTAALLAGALVYGTGVLDPATDAGVDGGWWAWRPVWIIACAAVGAAILPVMVWFERSGPPRRRPSIGWAVVGVVMTTGCLSWLLLGSVYDADGPGNVALLPVTGFIAGLAVLGVLTPARPSAR